MTFTYCGKAPEDFGCYYIPDEDQISDMMSEYEQFAEDFEARDGGYCFGDRQPPKEFDLPCYYEDIDKKTMEQIVRWVDRRTSGRLVFDERPDVYYDVVPSAKIEFEDYSYTKYGKTLHAGEFTIHFTAYDPFGKLTKKFLRTGEEMDYSTNLISETQMPPAPSVTDTSFQVYNPGTERTGLILRVSGDAPNGQVVKNTTNGQELALLPFNQAVTTTAGKWFEIDSKKGQVYLVGAATRELAFEYHDKGYIALEANLGFEDGRIISFSQGGNAVAATDDENGFSEDDIGKYIYTGDGWHKILSVSDVTIVGCGKNLCNSPVVHGTRSPSNGMFHSHAGVSTNWTSNVEIILVAGGETYTLSWSGDDSNPAHMEMFLFYENETLLSYTRQSSPTVTIPANANGLGFNLLSQNAYTTDYITDVQLEMGSAATAYEPYEDIPFLSLDNAHGQIERVAVEAGCVAQQAGAGDPSPSNIRAISGRESVEVVACGKNLATTQPVIVSTQQQIVVDFGRDTHFDTLVASFMAKNLTMQGADAASIDLRLADGTHQYRTWWDFLINGQAIQASGNPDGLAICTLNNVTFRQLVVYWMTDTYALIGEGSELSDFQLELGSSPLAYEPYTPMGGGVVTPSEPLYGLPDAEDTVDVDASGDVTVTRRTAVLELDGTEDWRVYRDTTDDNTLVAVVTIVGAALGYQTSRCSHFKNDDAAWDKKTFWTYTDHQTVDYKYFVVPKSQIADIAAWKSWLAAQKAAGTPVTIVYELAVPETEALTAITPITPEAGPVNIWTDADALTATVRGSGWEIINDTDGLSADIQEAQDDISGMVGSINTIENNISSIASQILTPDQIISTVVESTDFQTVSTQVIQTGEGLAVVQTTVDDLGDRVDIIEGAVVIQGANIDIGRSDSTTKLHLDNEGQDILEDGQATISVRDNKVVSPRYHVTDALIIGNLALRPSGGHLRLLKYGG